MTVKITLACTECKQRNYNKEKNKKNSPDRLDVYKRQSPAPRCVTSPRHRARSAAAPSTPPCPTSRVWI